VLALVTGTLLLSGASAGALVRRSGHAVKRAHSRARRALPAESLLRPAPVIPIRTTHEPPVDGVHDYPDVVGENQPPPLLVEPSSTEDPDQPSLFDVGTVAKHEEYDFPTATSSAVRPPRTSCLRRRRAHCDARSSRRSRTSASRRRSSARSPARA
jgi:hypothetical protein